MRTGKILRALALVVGAAVTLGASPARAEDAPDDAEAAPAPVNVVLADLSLGVIAAGYERVLDPGWSVSVAAGLYGPWYRREGVVGVGGEVRVLLFPERTAPGGFYVSPGFRAAYVGAADDDGYREGYALSGRFSVGYSITWDILVLRLGIGMQVHVLDLEEPVDAPSDDLAEPFPVADIHLGLALP